MVDFPWPPSTTGGGVQAYCSPDAFQDVDEVNPVLWNGNGAPCPKMAGSGPDVAKPKWEISGNLQSWGEKKPL